MQKTQRAHHRSQSDRYPDHQHQCPRPLIEQRIQIRRPVDRDDLSSHFQRPDRRLGESHADAEHQRDEQHQRQWQLARQLLADDGAEGHQADLQPLHEQHQPDDHREDAACNQPRIFHQVAQEQDLEQCQVEGQRYYGPQLVLEADRHIGLQDADDFVGPQSYRRGPAGQGLAVAADLEARDQRVEAELRDTHAMGTQIVGIAIGLRTFHLRSLGCG